MADKHGMRRREFLKRSAVAGSTAALASMGVSPVWARETDEIRVGVIGCGGRGSGAANNAVESAPGVKVVALADAFGDRLQGLKDKHKVADDRCFLGLDGYKKLLALEDVNYVILATPPGFRPIHFDAAVKAGKNIFTEKPVAVCPTGIRMVIEASAEAAKKGLGVAAGTQRRHQASYIETMKRVRDGAIGEIVSAQCYWNMGGLWVKKRQPDQSDVEYQLRNWLYFRWLSGDHICEQHVHNIDVINWAFGALPDSVHALGGRQWRTGPEYGNIYDHFGVEFFYPGDVRTISMCRQIPGTTGNVSERVVGTKGWSDCRGRIEGENKWQYEGKGDKSPYVQEHADLIASIRAGKPINEGRQVAESTLCAIMARESAYTRQQFKRAWFESRCTLNLLPPDGMKLSDAHPVPSAPVPGVYELAGLASGKKKK